MGSGKSQLPQTFFLSCTFGAKSTKSLRTSFSAGEHGPRRCTGRARSGLCATPWRTRRSPHPLFPRQTRVRNYCAAAGGSRIFIWHALRHSFFPQGDSRLGSDGERASGGLKARAAGRFACKPADSRPTPLSDVRTPTSESVGWLLLLFATEKQRKRKEFFSCTFGSKSTEKRERNSYAEIPLS